MKPTVIFPACLRGLSVYNDTFGGSDDKSNYFSDIGSRPTRKCNYLQQWSILLFTDLKIFPNTQADLFDQSPSLGLGSVSMSSLLPESSLWANPVSSSNSCLAETAHRQEQPNLQELTEVSKMPSQMVSSCPVDVQVIRAATELKISTKFRSH